MARYSNYPDEVESLRVLTMSFLKKENLLNDNKFKSGTITWTNKQHHSSNSISYSIKLNHDSGTLRLIYTHNNVNKVNYEIEMIAKESNLGFGKMWFFICPKTNKVCRKLHLNNGYFYHRTAFRNLYYEQQVHSKTNRILYSKPFIDAFRDELDFDAEKKYLKKVYKGKITKTYARILLRKRKAERVNLGILKQWL